MKFKTIALALLFSSISCFASTCYFIPPSSWECTDPKKLSKYVCISFVGKSKTAFKPSINLATEKTEASVKEYVQAIKNSYKNDKEATFREIGTINAKINEQTTIVEIDKKSPVGDICLLQSVTKKDEDIFVLTGAVLKKELLRHKDDFFNAFKSIAVTDNLLDEVEDVSQKRILEQKYKDLKEKKISIKDFEKHVEGNYDSLGPYWKILLLKQTYEEVGTK